MSSHEETMNNKLKKLILEQNLMYMGARALTGNENKTPWTEHEVYLLNKNQEDPNMHPYTCDRRGSKCEKAENDPNKDGVLIATKDGWICPCGEYKQDYY